MKTEVIADEALHEAFRYIQRAIGSTDGGIAGLWVSGQEDKWNDIVKWLTEYIEFEKGTNVLQTKLQE